MPDTHPIDDLFRQALASAAVEPPAKLGRSILAQAHARKRRGLLWRRRLLAFLLLLLSSGAGITWLLNQPVHDAAIAGTLPTVSGVPNSESLQPDATEEAKVDHEPEAAAPEPAQGADRTRSPRPASVSLRPRATESRKGMSTVAGIEAELDERAAGPESIMAGQRLGDAGTAETDEGTHTAGTARPPDERAFISLPRIPAISASLFCAALVDAKAVEYCSPRGYWWVGLGVIGQMGRYRWDGDSEKLSRALEGNGRWNPGFALGVSAGRGWPSGLCLGLGIEVERSGQAYRNVERATVTHTETVEQVVVLNTQVFASDLVTVDVQEQRESVAEGKDVRTRLRIPLELSWTLRRGRWQAGPRVGLIAEHTRTRSSSSLSLDPADGMIRSRALSDAELRGRYPLAFSGLIGVDVGFALRERTTVFATPFYSHAFVATSTAADAIASPDRTGLRLQIQHRF